jgi:hypothetical protein
MPWRATVRGDLCNGEQTRVNFSYDQDQEALASHARRLFEDASSWEVVKSAEPLGFSSDLWALVRQTGLCGISVEEWSGGQGGTLLDAAIVVEEAGRHGVPVPIVEQIVVGRLASRLRSISAELAEAIATGAVIGAIALEPAEAGSWRFLPGGAIAEVVCGLEGDSLVMVVEEPPMSAIPNLACSPMSHRESVGGTSPRPLTNGGPLLRPSLLGLPMRPCGWGWTMRTRGDSSGIPSGGTRRFNILWRN